MTSPANHILYTYEDNHNAHKALIAAQYGGVTNIVEQDIEFGVFNRTEEFYKLNPLGFVPTLKTVDGEGVFESNAIARYVAAIGSDADGLLGKTAIERARVDQWIEAVSAYISPNYYPLWAFRSDWGYAYDEEKFVKSREAIKAPLEAVERHFTQTSNQWLTGDRVTLADIILIVSLTKPVKYSLDADFRKSFPKTFDYVKRGLSQKEFIAVLGNIEFVEKFEP